MNGDVVASLLHQSVANREAGMVRGDGGLGVHIYIIHSRSMFFIWNNHRCASKEGGRRSAYLQQSFIQD